MSGVPIPLRSSRAEQRQRQMREYLSSRRGPKKWQRVSLHVLLVPRPRSRQLLTVTVLPVGKLFSVSAVVNRPPRYRRLTRANVTRGVEQVFEEHSHEVVGTFATAVEALKAADKYARRWLKDAKKKPTPCACEPIRKAG